MDTASEGAQEPRPNNLPVQVTSFVGRERELDEVRRLLGTTRLLTLTGSGGCGKTRLALRLGSAVLAEYPDGVWLVELAPLADSALVSQTVALALAVPAGPGSSRQDAVVEHLRPKHTCLILDNCEHVVGAVASLVDNLLRGCPDLRLIATSREPLDVGGETVWRVPSLPVPPPDPDSEALRKPLSEYAAVQLFLERALAAWPGFRLTKKNEGAVAEVCRRLDGIPLAIELAAARVRVFSVQQIAARLDDRFRLLTRGQRTALPRQQTLQAAVDWSYNLLAQPEQTFLRRLSVFAAGWSLEAAEAVCAGDGIEAYAILDLMAQLVEKSLVVVDEKSGGLRYGLLETIRHYALERLKEAGEVVSTREQHVSYFLSLAEDAEGRLRGAEEGAALKQLEEEHDNLRTALETALTTGDGESAIRLASALAYFWYLRGYLEEGLQWLTRALELAAAPSAARMKALHGAGWLLHHLRDSESARSVLQEGLTIARDIQDRASEAWILQVLGRVAYFDDDPIQARSFGEASLALAEQAGDAWLVAYALHLLGLAAYIAGRYDEAEQYYERSLTIRRETGYGEGIGILSGLMGLVALRKGENERALSLFREGVPIIRELIAPWGAAPFLGCFAYIAAVSGQPLRAALVGAATRAVVERYRTPLIPVFEPFLAEASDLARQALGDDAYAQAVEQGRAMSLEAALEEALATRVESGEADVPQEPAGPLSKLTGSELQVLRLLTTGRTTREIADELVVAVSTVDRHLTHIYQKLGVRNRAEAVALAMQLHLA